MTILPTDAAARREMLSRFHEIALEAGEAILAVRAKGVDVSHKADASPVTEADNAAEAIIQRELALLFPDIPVVAEEAAAAGKTPAVVDRFFLVDPLDGTKEFINDRDAFTVNIALIVDREPVAGVVYAPAMLKSYLGFAGEGAGVIDTGTGEQTPISVRAPQKPYIAVASKSHRDEKTNVFLAERGINDIVSIGSSLKFCLLAEGSADIYPRFGPTMEWDTAAGHAVLSAAGGCVTHLDGTPFLYGKETERFLNPGFLAYGQSYEERLQ